MATSWVRSRYTRVLTLRDDSVLIFSGISGATLLVPAAKVPQVRRILRSSCLLPAKGGSRAPGLLSHLVAGGFLVPKDRDELSVLRRRYRAARAKSRFVLTILPTFACNLACSYCFVGSKRGSMGVKTQDDVIRWARKMFATHRQPTMNVDWLGGEPLLELKVIRRLSRAFLDLCAAHSTEYSAQVITNGTLLSRESAGILRDCGIDRLQITIDGTRRIHDERRPCRKEGESSFEETMAGVESVIGRFVVRLRVNVDESNIEGVWELFEAFRQRGWMRPETRFYPYLARVSPLTEACNLCGVAFCDLDRFFKTQIAWISKLADLGVPVACQELYHFPAPRLYNCAAVGQNGFVVTPTGDIHKCGLTIDDAGEALANVQDLQDVEWGNAAKWRAFSPFTDAGCRCCIYLPTCLRGCPRTTICGRHELYEENCRYHRTWEDRMLVFHGELARVLRNRYRGHSDRQRSKVIRKTRPAALG